MICYVYVPINSLWLSDAICGQRYVNTGSLSDAICGQRYVNTGSDNGLLPDDTEPSPEPVLNSHQWGSVAFNLDQFLGKCSIYQFQNQIENYIPKNYNHIFKLHPYSKELQIYINQASISHFCIWSISNQF